LLPQRVSSNAGRIFLAATTLCLSSVQQSPIEQADRARLTALLKKSQDYCQRLDKAALDFVCLEEVTELSAHLTPETNVYLYDYQFIRKNQETKEKRNLIELNGKKSKSQASMLLPVAFQYENVLFGPVGLLSKFWQAYHDYKLVGEETINKENVLVIEATPGPVVLEPHCYGRIWVKEDDGSVLKIVWDQRSLGNYPAIEEWAKTHDVEPQITSFSEYGFEKNGLRFPSRNYSEQAYMSKDRGKMVTARISIIYKNYKFFTVETEVKY
jgi:hypothetical protein